MGCARPCSRPDLPAYSGLPPYTRTCDRGTRSSQGRCRHLRQQSSLLRRGYARLPSPEALWGREGGRAHALLCDRLASACCVMRRLGWHLAWILLYDEPWLLARMYGPVLRHLSYGRLDLNPDYVFFHVEPGARGWPPHRDRPSMPLLTSDAGSPASTPAYVTCWVALTAATPDNGCVYVVPADMDPLYDTSGTTTATRKGATDAETSSGSGGGDGDGDGCTGPDVARTARYDSGGDRVDDVSVPDLLAVRALPAAVGEALLWSGRLLHWGGAADAESTDPRVSLYFAASASEFEPPGLRGVDLTAAAAELPTLRQRLLLIAVQLAVHEHQEPFPPSLAAELRWLEGALGPTAGPSPSPPPSAGEAPPPATA